jgi:hypothetical protein
VYVTKDHKTSRTDTKKTVTAISNAAASSPRQKTDKKTRKKKKKSECRALNQTKTGSPISSSLSAVKKNIKD